MIDESSKQKQSRVRQDIVKYAQEYGIKAAARHFGCSKNTVKKWVARHKEGGIKALQNERRKPHNIPHKLSKDREAYIVACRKKSPCYGPKRLKWAYPEITCSEAAIARVLKEHELTKKRRKKYQRKQDLRQVKAKYKALSHHQEDVKHLYDIPHYWPQLESKGLPRYQLTIRDTKSGMMLLGYGAEYSELYSTIMTEQYLAHLKRHGIKPGDITIQTDNGTEFGGTRRRHICKPGGFVHTIEQKHGAHHVFIPPGMSNANADVESVHATIEDEFFDLEDFVDRKHFLAKAQVYQYFYNTTRLNFSKAGKTPAQIILEDRPDIDPSVINFPVVDLDAEFLKRCEKTEPQKKMGVRGQHVPKLPVSE